MMQTAFERLKSLIGEGNYTENANGWINTRCPSKRHSNGDSNPSLGFKEFASDQDPTETRIGFHCFAGCSEQEILAAYGLTWKDAYSKPDGSFATTMRMPKAKEAPTIFDLEQYVMLPRQYLMLRANIEEKHVFMLHKKSGDSYTVIGFKIPYYNHDGTEHERSRIRKLLEKPVQGRDTRFLWSEGDEKPIAYGLQHLDDAEHTGYLVIVEGESDTWTLDYHGIPALGIPGATDMKVLDGALLKRIPTIYVIQEKTDQAGINFPFAVQVQLRNTGYTGTILRVPLRTLTNAKDPSELHKKLWSNEKVRNHDAFRAAFQEALNQAKPMDYDTGKTEEHTENIRQEVGQELPDVLLVNQLRDKTEAALNALMIAESKAPTMFVQTDRIVRVYRDKEGRPGLASMGIAEIRNAMTNSANYYKVTVDKEGVEGLIPTSPPKEVAENILALTPERWPFPAIRAVVEMPVIRPDGSILDTPGYDAATCLYYYPDASLELPAIPEYPTREHAKEAAKYIGGFIGDFPYVDGADKANTYGLFITTVIRHLVRHVPCALVNGTKAGTGKGLLTDGTALVATGRTAASIAQIDSEEEWDKRITALLMNGATFISIDNVEGVLRSAILSKALTSDYHNGRVLGISKMVNAPQKAIWLANGNNIQLGGDMPRRCYPIRMATQVSDPWGRPITEFKYPNLIQAITSERPKIIAALLTMVRSWYIAGKPAPETALSRLATFSEWVDIVGGVLAYAGIDGFLENLTEMHEKSDVDGKAWTRFLETWRNKLGLQEYTTKKLMDELSKDPEFADTLPDPFAALFLEQSKSLSRKLGKALAKKNGTPFGADNLRIVQGEDTDKKVATFKVTGYTGYTGYKSSLHSDEKNEHCDTDMHNTHTEHGAEETTYTTYTPCNDAPLTPENAANYPYDAMAEIGKPEPSRPCLQCQHTNWLPWYTNGQWMYQCGECYPGLRASRGRDKFFVKEQVNA